MNLQVFQSLISAQKDNLRALGLKRVGIFGSVSRGETKTDSDIDVLLDFAPQKKTYRNFYQTTELLEQIFKRKIDAVTPEGLSPYIKPHIEQDIYYVQIA